MQMIEALLAKDVNVDAQVNFHRPSRIGNNGRFIEPLFSTGCTPLLQATIAKDIPLMKALLAKGASPNINGMGVTAFLNAAGVGTGVRFDPIHAPNMESVKLLVEFGADVNAQVTNTGSYSQRIARAPATNEGMSALHVAVQRGEVELVTFLLSHGINAELRDAQGKKAIDLLPAEAPLKKLQTAAEAGVSGPVAVRAPDAEEIVQIRALFANANPSR
jgi:ankyrin repeat protein